jgi:hypothetical protein
MHATTEELLEAVFSVGSSPRLYILRGPPRPAEWSRIMRQLPAMNTKAEDSTAFGRHQATNGEDTADWKDLVLPVVNCWVCEFMTALNVVMVCKSSINTITNLNPTSSHTTTWLICNSQQRLAFKFKLFSNLLCNGSYLQEFMVW